MIIFYILSEYWSVHSLHQINVALHICMGRVCLSNGDLEMKKPHNCSNLLSAEIPGSLAVLPCLSLTTYFFLLKITLLFSPGISFLSLSFPWVTTDSTKTSNANVKLLCVVMWVLPACPHARAKFHYFRSSTYNGSPHKEHWFWFVVFCSLSSCTSAYVSFTTSFSNGCVLGFVLPFLSIQMPFLGMMMFDLSSTAVAVSIVCWSQYPWHVLLKTSLAVLLQPDFVWNLQSSFPIHTLLTWGGQGLVLSLNRCKFNVSPIIFFQTKNCPRLFWGFLSWQLADLR